ncbi:hypothetical protein PSAR109036_02505 [Psychrobacter arenosus]|uniref:hypothetical protein n=1 Tax=Psychrobacter arenosus TaxID=256326 RepID=UPI00191A3361|nr:hypothetical protein [Psychrobacter arenosus]
MHIGYYAHYHGSGHCRQADKLANLLSRQSPESTAEMTVFTSVSEEDYTFIHLQAKQVVRLPLEHELPDDILPGRAGAYWQPDCMHYSPVNNADIKARSLILLEQIAQRQIALMIIDLSVEVALLCRAASIPYLYVRLPGEREDTPHHNAFQGAIGLLAAYPECLESPETPQWVRQKTLYLGFLQTPKTVDIKSKDIKPLDTLSKSMFIEQLRQRHMADRLPQPLEVPIITVIKGYGGHAQIDAALPALRSALPQAFIISLGPIDSDARQWVDLAIELSDTQPFLQHSDLLVMACGLNAIAEACQATTITTPLLVIPDERPHREQEMMAQGLISCGRAVSLNDFLAWNNSGSGLAPALDMVTPSTIQTQLQQQLSAGFMESLAQADSAKAWFYNWLLPRLGLTPESMPTP